MSRLTLVKSGNDVTIRYRCMSCGYASDDTCTVCPGCGNVQTFAPEESESEPKQPEIRRRRARLASEVPKKSYIHIPTGRQAWDEALGGGFVRPSTVLVHGPKGTGKTTAMLDLATRIARKLGGLALYGTAEMSSELLRHYAERSGVELRRLVISDAGETENLLADIEEFEPVITVWDSVQAFTWEGSSGETELRQTMRAAIRAAQSYEHISLMVSQVTKELDFLGPSEVGHNVDVIVELRKKKQTLFIECGEKNRFAETPRVGTEEIPTPPDLKPVPRT